MTKDVKEMQNLIISMLKEYDDYFQVRIDSDEKYEVAGTVETMQGRKKVDGMYFASVVPKPKDVRFYFFPIYTHKDEMGPIPGSIQKALKGKSCFHIKKIDPEIKAALEELIANGVSIYKKHGLLK